MALTITRITLTNLATPTGQAMLGKLGALAAAVPDAERCDVIGRSLPDAGAVVHYAEDPNGIGLLAAIVFDESDLAVALALGRPRGTDLVIDALAARPNGRIVEIVQRIGVAAKALGFVALCGCAHANLRTRLLAVPGMEARSGDELWIAIP